jgi:hypothetical protein
MLFKCTSFKNSNGAFILEMVKIFLASDLQKSSELFLKVVAILNETRMNLSQFSKQTKIGEIEVFTSHNYILVKTSILPILIWLTNCDEWFGSCSELPQLF